VIAPRRVLEGPLCLPVARWPDRDRQAWYAILGRAHGPFRRTDALASSSPWTTRAWERSYGRWLTFRRSLTCFDPAVTPSARVTAELLDTYFHHLRSAGNSGITILGRFTGLEAALRLLEPDIDHRWITRPNGVSLRRLLDLTPRPVFVPDSAVLLRWSRSLFRRGCRTDDPRQRRILIRDALIIGILATRAPRLRALSLLTLSRHVVKTQTGWDIRLTPEIGKTRRDDTVPVAAAVVPMLERYVCSERLELLDGRPDDALLIAEHGRPLTAEGISAMIKSRSKARFGRSFGAHRFRHALATKAAMSPQVSVLDAARILGHGPEVTVAHYVREKNVDAMRRHSQHLDRLCAMTEGVAERAFGSPV
jgi:integrase